MELPVYRELLPLYFPRSAEEEAATAMRVPKDIGNKNGEPVIEERTIRIAQSLSSESGERDLSNAIPPCSEKLFALHRGSSGHG